MLDVTRLRLPRGGHFFFIGHHFGILAVIFVVLLVLAIRNSRSR
jgi:hypothetical protein